MSFIVLKIHASWGWERSETLWVYPDTPDIGPVWCPDIPDESPDTPDGAMQNFRPFDVIYAFCILPWLIILGNQDIVIKSKHG